jgi:hypothetical protein
MTRSDRVQSLKLRNSELETRNWEPELKGGYERGKKGIKHLKTKSMDYISIKDHPPWYARGTPVTNTRDGPVMALNNKLLFAICRGPSGEGRGKGEGQGRGGSQQAAVGSWQSEDCSRPPERKSRAGRSEVGSWQLADRRQNPDSYLGEERSRGEPKGKTRRWLTLKTTFFNTQKSVYGQWYAVLGSFADTDRACTHGMRECENACPNELVQAGMNEGKEGLCGGSPFRAGV